jgi:hypothetical protein
LCLPDYRSDAARSELRGRDAAKADYRRGDKTFGEWWAEYDVADEDAVNVHQIVSDTFRFAFEGAVKVSRQSKGLWAEISHSRNCLRRRNL